MAECGWKWSLQAWRWTRPCQPSQAPRVTVELAVAQPHSSKYEVPRLVAVLFHLRDSQSKILLNKRLTQSS